MLVSLHVTLRSVLPEAGAICRRDLWNKHSSDFSSIFLTPPFLYQGLVELIVLNVGLQAGVLDQQLFATFVIMCLVTTFMATPL